MNVEPPSRHGVDGDVSARLLDDPVDGGQAEARAPPALLGREERLEDVGQDFGVHPAAGVLHGEGDVGAGRHRRRIAAGWLASTVTFRVERVSPPPAGMASRALTARFITTCSICTGSALMQSRPGSTRTVRRTFSSSSRRQHLAQVGQDHPEVEHLGGQDLLAAEGEELAGEAGRALGRLLDLADLPRLRPVRLASGGASRCSR